MKKTVLKIISAAAAFFAAVFLSSGICSAICRMLENGGQSYIYQYASDGRFDQNIYFSAAVNQDTGVLDDIQPYLTDKHGGLIGIARDLSKYRIELLPILSENHKYLDHLHQLNTSIEELFVFCDKIDKMVENIAFACRYLMLLGWVILVHFFMRCRPALYFGMGVVCIFASVLKLSDKLFAALLFHSPQTFDLFANQYIPTLLEAMLTFLIFDITIASLEKLRVSRKLEKLYDDLPALYFLIIRLSQYTDNTTQYRSNLSALMPHISVYSPGQKNEKKKAMRLAKATQALRGPHDNRSFINDLIDLLSILPPK